jgi:hypothetical protein
MNKHPSQSAATQEPLTTFHSKVEDHCIHLGYPIIEQCNFHGHSKVSFYSWVDEFYMRISNMSCTVAIFRVKWKDVDKST